jgi:hypothetical protein
MANKRAVLDKISRNLAQESIANTRDSSNNVLVDSLVVSYVDASIQSPMGGVDGSVSPFLGIGIAAPGKLKIKGAAGQNTIAAIMTSQLRLQVLKAVGDIGNNVIIEAGDTATQLAEIRAHADLNMMGQ